MKESEVPRHITYAMKFPIRIDVSIRHRRGLSAVYDWMEDNIGVKDIDWACVSSESMFVKHIFYFENEADKVMFILKWL